MTDLATRASDILATDPTLVDAMAAVGITLRRRLPGEHGDGLSSLTWLDAASGEPITTASSRAGWELLHWLAGTAGAT